jgi:hypothetical protein
VQHPFAHKKYGRLKQLKKLVLRADGGTNNRTPLLVVGVDTIAYPLGGESLAQGHHLPLPPAIRSLKH